MFEVITQDGKTARKVYSIRTNPKTNEIEFLIYSLGFWDWLPAKLYKPVNE